MTKIGEGASNQPSVETQKESQLKTLQTVYDSIYNAVPEDKKNAALAKYRTDHESDYTQRDVDLARIDEAIEARKQEIGEEQRKKMTAEYLASTGKPQIIIDRGLLGEYSLDQEIFKLKTEKKKLLDKFSSGERIAVLKLLGKDDQKKMIDTVQEMIRINKS